MRRLGIFARLPVIEQRLLMQSWMLLAGCTLRVRLLPISLNRNWIFRDDGIEAAPPTEEAEKIAWAIGVASRYVPGCRCLPQALAARSMLASRGYHSEVKIAVRKQTEQLEAHAWLETNGRVWVGEVDTHPTSERPSWAVLR